MTTIRQELEQRIAAVASSLIPPIPVVYEDVPFTKPTTSPFVECFLTPSVTKDVTVDGTRQRELGTLQINIWVPSGKGAATGERLAQAFISAFPIVPKTGSVSIEQTPYMSRAITDVSGWRIIPITTSYRREIETI